MQKLLSCVAVGAAVFLCSAAQAVTIDFNALHHTGDTVFTASPYESNGFTIKNDCVNQSRCFEVLGTAFPIPRYNMDIVGAALWVENPYSTTTVAMTSGSTFSFMSVDLAEGTNDGYTPGPGGSLPGTPTVMRFTFNYAVGGSATQFVTLDNAVGGQTFMFSQTGLSSVDFVNVENGAMGFYQFDNVVVAAPVPEPGTYALMLGGLALLASARKSRRASTTPGKGA